MNLKSKNQIIQCSVVFHLWYCKIDLNTPTSLMNLLSKNHTLKFDRKK